MAAVICGSLAFDSIMNFGGKFADQNVKPEAPATNDPWGIASVVASVMGEPEPTLPATKQQPTTEVFASEGDQQPNEEPAEWVDHRAGVVEKFLW